ncbi:MAG: DUF58 domain-containing protein [Acidimicrobiales bacterium]
MFPVPSARLVVLAALASVVVLVIPLRQPFGLVAVDSVLALVALADGLLSVDPARIGVDRRLPGALTLGGPAGVITWALSNPSGRSVRVAIADDLAPSLCAGRRRVQVRLPGRGSAQESTTVTPERRGHFLPRELVVRVDGPLGLASRQRRRKLEGSIRVLPAFRSRAEAELRIDRAMTIGIRSTRDRGRGTDFDSLRDYTVDDEFRRMDWSATARAGHAIVRTFRAERNQQVVILLDAGRLMAAQVAEIPRLEHAMDAAMTLTSVVTRLGDQCGLVDFDSRVRAIVAPGRGTQQFVRVVDAVYDLEASLVESDYRAAFAIAASRFRRRSLFVVLTELGEDALFEALMPALPLLLTRHLVIVASVSDPQVRSWAAEVPSDAREAYRYAAAGAAVERRSSTVSQLRRTGAMIVDAPPRALAGAVADAYLGLKAEGRL